MRIPSRRHAAAAAVLSLAIVGAGGGIAWATGVTGGVPDTAGVIHACYVTNAPLKPVVLLDPSKGTTCPGGMTPLAFNQTGPQGPQGVQGIQGPACASTDPKCVGPQGPPGANGANGVDGNNGTNGTDGTNGTNGTNGVSGYEIVHSETAGLHSGDAARVVCPTGKHAVGGGGEISDGSDSIVSGTAPILGGVGWEATIHDQFTLQQDATLDSNNDVFRPSSMSVTVWAVCVSTS